MRRGEKKTEKEGAHAQTTCSVFIGGIYTYASLYRNVNRCAVIMWYCVLPTAQKTLAERRAEDENEPINIGLLGSGSRDYMSGNRIDEEDEDNLDVMDAINEDEEPAGLARVASKREVLVRAVSCTLDGHRGRQDLGVCLLLLHVLAAIAALRPM